MSSVASRGPVTSNTFAYIVFVAGVCAALHVWKLPPALPELQRQLGMTLVESGFLLSLVQMGGMSLGLMIGLVAEKVGLRRCILLGLSLLTASSALGPLFESKAALLLFRALEGLGFLMVVMPAPGLIRRLVEPAYLSRLLGLWGCYVPFATIIVLIFGSWLLSFSHWQVLWWLLAVLTGAIWWLVWSRVPSDAVYRSAAATDAAAAPAPRAWSIVCQTLSSRNVWLVALSFLAYSSQWMAVVGFLPSIYVVEGFSGTTAGFMTAIVGGSNALGNFWGGRLLHKGLQPQTLIATGFITMGLCSFVAFALNISTPVQLVMVFLFSAVGGLIPATLFYLVIQLAPSRQTTSTSVGWMQQCTALGQFIGPPIVAWVATLAGGWQMTWVVTGLFSLAGIAMAWMLGKALQARGTPI